MGKRNRMRSRKDMRAKKGTRSEEARRRVSPRPKRGATDGREKQRNRGVAQKGGEGWWWRWWWRVVLTRAMRYKIAKRYGTFFALFSPAKREKVVVEK